MRLQMGQTAPFFAAQDTHGRLIRLDDYRGHYLLLSFYRHASCPFCNLRIHELMQRLAEFENVGLSLVAVFQSPPEQIAQYIGKQRPPFVILPDPRLYLFHEYGVETSLRALLIGATRKLGRVWRAVRLGFFPGRVQGSVARVPADFLIGPRGEILIAYYGRDISDHVPIETLLQKLRVASSPENFIRHEVSTRDRSLP